MKQNIESGTMNKVEDVVEDAVEEGADTLLTEAEFVALVLEVSGPSFHSLTSARALREIRHYQKQISLLIGQKPFERLCRQVLGDCAPNTSYRFSKEAIGAIQATAETVLVELFEMTFYHSFI